MKKNEYIWTPNPGQQTLALQQTAFEILYGGARGGGKTDAGIAWPLRDAHNPRLRALIIRRNSDDLSDWIDRATRIYSQLGAITKGQPAEFHFPSGAIFKTGHLKDENAFTKYQGHEYHRIIIEELTQIPTLRQYLSLLASCRSTIDLKPQIFLTCNPGGPGHTWVKDRFRIGERETWDKAFLDEKEKRTRVFVHATVEDNPILVSKDPSYVDFLNSLPDDLRKAWREGNWDNPEVEGAYYTNELLQARKEGRVGDFKFKMGLPVYTWWDIGRDDATSIGFFQKSGNAWYMIDYYEKEGEGLPHFVDIIKQKRKYFKYSYEKHFAPHDIAVTEWGSDQKRRDIASNLGLEFETLPKLPVEDGINAVRTRFSTLHIDSTNGQQFLEAIGNYRKKYDEDRKIFKPYHDWTSHAADMIRMWAITPEEETTIIRTQFDWTPVPTTFT